MAERAKLAAKAPEPQREHTPSQTRKPVVSQSMASPVGRILHLQKTVGNRAVQRMIRFGVIQAKLRIGQPNDIYEQEADRVADQVMRMPEPRVQRQVEPEEEEEEQEETLQAKPLAVQVTPLVQRQAEPEEEEEEELVQSKTLAEQGTPLIQKQAEPEEEEEGLIMTKSISGSTHQIRNDLPTRLNQSRGSGQPLPENTRSFMESRFGYDFSQVKIYNDTNSNRVAKALNAKAFTRGQEIVFNAGQYSPETNKGKQLIAHELTHVVQQSKNNNLHNTRRSQHIQCQLFGQTFRIGQILRSLATPLTQQQIDQIVSLEIQRQLQEFRNIVVNVNGIQVVIQAAYYMNTAAGRRRRRSIRRAFSNVVRRLRQASMIRTGAGRPYTSGQAVRFGKATPQDITRFMNTFINTPRGRNAIIRYARRQRWLARALRRRLRQTRQLHILGTANLQRLLQQWVRAVGIGVDCSGFVLQALIRAREAVRRAAQLQNVLAPIFGLPLSNIPRPFRRGVRTAHSFRRGQRVRRPVDLRPGDAWLVNYGPRGRRNVWRHIRIIMNTRIIRNAAGNPQRVRFTTAESRSRRRVGPVSRTWLTRSARRFGLGGIFRRWL